MYSGLREHRAYSYLIKNWFTLFAVVVYLFFAFYYMGPGFMDCTNSIYGFGDSTAGPIWRNSLEPEQPIFGGDSNKTNYPYGESLYSPVGFAASVQTVFMGITSEIVGPVCAYNLYNISGYVFTALIMFFFINYLTKSRWIALLAGYAVSYTPYIQSKIGGHPNYAFGGLLIAVIWLMLHFVAHRKVSTALLLGAALAICAYLDPYFMLLAATAVAPLIGAWVIVDSKKILSTIRNYRAISKQQILPFGVAILAFLTLITPLVVVRIKDAGVINSTVSKSRGNVMAAATQCSNLPLDYLLPDPTNIHLVNMFGPGYQDKNVQLRNWCGFGESRVSISLMLITLVLSAASIAAWERQNGYRKNNIKLSYDKNTVILGVVGIGMLAAAIGLPPYVHGVITPSGVILHITEMWRIFAREYLLVNIAIVILAAIAMFYFSRSSAFRDRKIIKIILFLLVAGLVLAEYQINQPFRPVTFNYSRDVPTVYEKLRDDTAAKVIAEYPMDRIGLEYDSVVYYMTMQSVHMKSMVNSVLSTDSKETVHIAIKDLSDPQTIPALRFLGVDKVVVHGEDISEVLKVTDGQLVLVASSEPPIYGLTMVRPDDTRTVGLFQIKDGQTDTNVLTIESGYVVNLPLIHSPVSTEYEITNGASLRQTMLGKDSIDGAACFDIKMSSPGDSGTLSVIKNKTTILSLDLDGAYRQLKVPIKSGENIVLKNDKGYNMRIDNLNGECYVE